MSEQVQKEMLARMRRIEGQARGVQRMIAEDRDCLEILTQLASLRSAAYSTSVALAQNFAVQCLRNGDERASADEAVPLTILAFFPQYRMTSFRSPTTDEMLDAYAAARDAGLRNVRVGNIGVFARSREEADRVMEATEGTDRGERRR